MFVLAHSFQDWVSRIQQTHLVSLWWGLHGCTTVWWKSSKGNDSMQRDGLGWSCSITTVLWELEPYDKYRNPFWRQCPNYLTTFHSSPPLKGPPPPYTIILSQVFHTDFQGAYSNHSQKVASTLVVRLLRNGHKEQTATDQSLLKFCKGFC